MFFRHPSQHTQAKYQVVIIGAGPSGLAASYGLKSNHIDHIILEKSNHVANSWRQTWDNFQLAMPVKDMVMPGLDCSTFSPDEHLKRDQVIQLFERYAKEHQLPIEFGIDIHHIFQRGDIFVLITNNGMCTAENVIICTGPRHRLKIPEYAKHIPQHLLLHGTDYKNVSMLPKEQSHILVVGSGYSSLNIAYDILHHTQHQLYLACAYQENQIKENNSHLLFHKGKNQEKFSLTYFLNQGVKNFGRLIDVENNQLIFSDEQKNKKMVASSCFSKIIFATGYEYSFPMLNDLPGMSAETLPKHVHGKTNIPGLYVAGIPSDVNQRTVTINQGSQEAEKIVRDLVEHVHSSRSRAKL